MNSGCSRVGSAVLVVIALLSLAAAVTVAQDPNDLVQKALDDSTFDWRSSEVEDGVRVYYTTGSFAERHRATLARSAAAAWGEVQATLEEPGYESVLNVFYVESREEMERIVGRPVTGFANWSAGGIFLVVNPEWRSFEKHEMTHIVTLGVWDWPDSTSRWMVEGICIYVDGWCREYSVDEIAFQYMSGGQLPPLQTLFDDYRSLGEIRGGVSAASLIGFVHDTYGIDAVRSLWDNGSGDVKQSIGVSLDELESLWKEHLGRTADKDVEVDLEAIDEFGCG